MHKSSFKAWLKQLRSDIFEAALDPNNCNFNLPELAERAGVSYSTVYAWHVGTTQQPRLSTAYSLAKAVGMDMRYVKAPAGKGLRRAS